MEALQLVWLPIGLALNVIEQALFLLIRWYDAYCYTPLQTTLSPFVAKVPRAVDIRGRKVDVFTANIVSWSRTALVIPIAWCLKYDHPLVAFLCVLLHDFLDHLDGIVAKVQKSIFGQLDDPLLGGFMDAFCDKIVNCLALWSILLVTDFSSMTTSETWLFVGACAVIIAYEFVLGVVRVQDYFQAYYFRKYCAGEGQESPNVAAVMEGKLKEKLESLGIGFLCLAQAAANPMESVSGMVGVLCLLLSIRLAHASLQHKLKPRRQQQNNTSKQPIVHTTVTGTDSGAKFTYDESTDGNDTEDKEIQADIDGNQEVHIPEIHRNMSVYEADLDSDDDDEKSDVEKDQLPTTPSRSLLTRTHSVPTWRPDGRKMDKVYTVGCFDLFHDGHRILLERLQSLGKQVIVGIHDSRSIFKLKKKVPIDSTTKRMANVKKYASMVFCIHGTDPTPYLRCIYDEEESSDSMYVRGDDMPNFPSRKFIESVMPIHFLPYSEFISSTKIRKEVYNASMFGPHVLNDDDNDHAAMFY
ncbi:uncharacterized protein LOC128244327 [Mya arenaria]|uniref:uncharacterized protein LOC128244327 n=1 Tax=Mya arenaria TaxID=6604 RepID=UPI0022E44F4D|nr:uncharacterized protein LOC128244327 [Mya arenaria]